MWCAWSRNKQLIYFGACSFAKQVLFVTYAMNSGFRCFKSVNFRRMALSLSACVCVPCTAWAGPFDTIHPYVGVSESYDGNLLGISNNAEAKQILGSTNTGDWSHVEQVGISLDDQIGLQHITADINASKGQYDRFTPLDYSAKSAQGDWNWSLGTHLTGNLGATYVESLAPYTFVHDLSVNLRTQKTATADATWLFHPSWRVVAGMSATQTHYELLAEQPDDRSEYRANVGWITCNPTIVRPAFNWCRRADISHSRNFTDRSGLSIITFRMNWMPRSIGIFPARHGFNLSEAGLIASMTY